MRKLLRNDEGFVLFVVLGAVSVITGHVTGETDTLPLRIEKLYHEFSPTAPFAVATLLAVLALVTLALKVALEWKARREHEKGQQARQEGLDTAIAFDPRPLPAQHGTP